VGELWEADGGAEICVKGEVFAEGEEGGALWLLIGWESFPLGTANGAEEDGVSGTACLERGLGEGVAAGIDGGAADEALGEIESERKFFSDGGEDAEGFCHDLGADTVAGEYGNFKGAHPA